MSDALSSFINTSDALTSFNAQRALVWAILSKLGTCTLVEVVSCTNSGGLTAVGLVDVLPLVNQVDSTGQPIPHVTIHNCPYFRLQGGKNAIILDPQVGDIGTMVFADRDISSVIQNKAQSNPGSSRMFSMSDGLYFGGDLNGVPTQFVEFSSTGIRISSQQQVELDAPTVTINANTFDVIAPTVSITATTSVGITTPTMTLNGALVVDGASTLNGAVSQTGGGVSSFSGNVSSSGTITNNGVNIGSTHEHQVVNIQTGSSTINTAVPH